MRNYVFNAKHAEANREIAAKHGVKLPPIAWRPGWWPAFLTAPQGPVVELPDTPKRILLDLFKRNKWLLLVATIVSSLSMVSAALLAWALGLLLDAGIDQGLGPHLVQPVLIFVAILVLLTVTSGAYQLFEIGNLLQAQMTSARSSSHHVAKRRGSGQSDMATGDIIATITTDSSHVGSLMSYVPDLIASLVTTVVIGYLMLTVSVPLGLVVLVGMPLVVGLLSLIIKPLENRQGAQREAQGALTNIGTDAVTGLRVLRGIGGEDQFGERYRKQSDEVRKKGIHAARPQAVLSSASQGTPPAFALVVVAIAAFMVFDGTLTPGEMVAFYGFAGYLSSPLFNVIGAMQVGTRAWVGLKKIARVQELDSSVSDSISEGAASLTDSDFDQSLTDETSGVQVEGRVLTALVAADPDVSAALATRMARTDDKYVVTLGDIDLRTVPVEELRNHVVLASADDHLFSGTLRENLLASKAELRVPLNLENTIFQTYLDNRTRAERPLISFGKQDGDDRLLEAMRVADAADVLDSIPGGLDGEVAEKGRTLSGGQRQRVALARAVATGAEVLIAIEPTSAVDSHTEARIAARLREARAGKTTILVTASPLVLDQCDQVILVDEEGREVTRGTHGALMDSANQSDPAGLAYRAVVQRSMGGAQ